MKLVHPISGQAINVAADRLAMYQSQGWLPDAPVASQPAAAGESVEESSDKAPATKRPVASKRHSKK